MVSIHHERGELAAGITPVSSLSEATAAIAVIVLSILGLVGVIPDILLGVTTIVVGCGILLMGAQTAAEYVQVSTVVPTVGARAGAAGGITLDFLAGGAGIVLGILGLFSHLAVLAPAALIVFGGTLLLVGGAMARRQATPAASVEAALAEMMVDEIGLVSSGAQVLVGIAAMVLGILALVSIHAAALTFVGLMAVGAGLLVGAVGRGGFASLARS